jgi:membrane fusion protein (multidrug efflux system)
MKKRELTILINSMLLAGGTLVALAGISCKGSAGSATAPKKAPEVRVAAASRSAISRTLELTGSVEPYRTAQLASPAEGPVMNLKVREGDRVAAGEELLAIGRTEGVSAAITSFIADAAKERQNLERVSQLVQSGALAGEQLDIAKASYERAQAQLVKAEESAHDYSVTAPWDGVVSRVRVRDGDFVAPRTPLVEMFDPRSLLIRAAVPEERAVAIHAGMALSVVLDAYPDTEFQARVDRVYPSLDPRTRTRTLEAKVSGPVKLLPAMFARLMLAMETAEDAVVVPGDAVVSAAGQTVAFVLEDGKAVQRPVETGIEAANRIQIVTGLQPGDNVIVAGNERLKNGDAVRVAGEKAGGEGRPSQGKADTPKDSATRPGRK